MTDTTPRAKVKYYTQRRLSHPLEPGKFEKCCAGHDDVYEAMACAETIRAALVGEPDRRENTLAVRALDARIHAEFLELLAAGVAMELRVVKYTVINETVEDLGAITMDCVKPKKEVP